MHNCPPKESLERFLAQALNDDDSCVVEEHLADCSICQARMHELTDEPLEGKWRKRQTGTSESLSPADSEVVQGLSERIQSALADGSATLNQHGKHASERGEQTHPELPGYEILNVLAHGGMSVVYLARQFRPSRQVAIKFISKGVSEHGKPTDRLFAEADALARLHHPNFVEIFEVGEYGGQPFLVLEFLAGGTLEDSVRGAPLPFERVASLIGTLAEAMEAAHRAGLVHRDLKPSNILLTTDGIPKIGDFGLVKDKQSENGLTTAGTVMGTPSYMAPEQAGGHGAEISAATDVYALGAVLYALLTGRPPFKGANQMETVLQVLHNEPPPPSMLRPQLPRDLQTITLHCLEKDPKRRYGSAALLAADLRHYLKGEPIAARPLGAFGRTIKWIRRRPAIAALLAVVVLGGTLSLALVTWLWERAEARATTEATARALADESQKSEKSARLDIERLSAGLALDQAQSLCNDGDVAVGLTSFIRALDFADRAGDADLERTVRGNLAAWRHHFVGRPTILHHPSWVLGATFSPDEKVLLTACLDNSVRLWDVATGTLLGEPLKHDSPLVEAEFSPNGRQILTASRSPAGQPGSVRLWDAETHKLLVALPHPGLVNSAKFSSDGATFLTACTKQAQVWKRDCTPLGPPLRHGPADVLTAVYSNDARTIATGGSDGNVQLWSAADGKSIGAPMHHEKGVEEILFHPSGRVLATRCEKEHSVRLWDVTTCQPIGEPLKHNGPVKAMQFSKDGRRFATASAIMAYDPLGRPTAVAGGEARLWQATTGKLLRMPIQHPMPVWSLAFNTSGERLLTGCEDGIGRIFDCNTGEPISNALRSSGTMKDVVFSRNGLLAATASAGASARLWDLEKLQDMGATVLDDRAVRIVGFSPNSQILAAGCENGMVLLWNRQQRKLEPFSGRHDSQVRALAWSSNGMSILTGGDDKLVKLWEYPSGKLLRNIPQGAEVFAAAALPDQQGYLTGEHGGSLLQWDKLGLLVGSPLDTKKLTVTGLAVTPDGHGVWLATPRVELKCVQLRTGRILQTIEQKDQPYVLALSPDGKTLLTGQRYKPAAQLWDVTTARPKGPPLLMNGEGVVAASFAPDGQTVLVCSSEGGRLWDVKTGKPVGPLLPEPKCQSGAISPDGHTVVTAGKYGARFWPTFPPLTGPLENLRREMEALTGFELDREGTIRELEPGSVKGR